MKAIEDLPWNDAHKVSERWNVFQVNVREERQKMEKQFSSGIVRGPTQYNNGESFNDNGNVVEFLIAWEGDANALNKASVEEYTIDAQKFENNSAFQQSQAECLPIEEELFAKTTVEDSDGNETIVKKTEKHTNYAKTSFNRRIEILVKFFSQTRYETTLTMYTQMRMIPHQMKSEYSFLKDALKNAYQRFIDQKVITPTIQMAPITNGYDNGTQGYGTSYSNGTSTQCLPAMWST